MAAKFGKWVGGILGWAVGGTIGAAVGFSLGYLWDGATLEAQQATGSSKNQTHEGDFNISLLVLAAAVMKADQRVLKSELSYVKSFLLQNYREVKAQQLLSVLKEILEREIDVRGVCLQIRQYMTHPQRLQLVHFLIGIARADGHVDVKEVQLLKQIAAYLNVSIRDFESMGAMYEQKPTKEHHYKVLELDTDASKEEIKKAYRRMAKKYHPDRLGDVGEDVKEASLEKFRKVQEAYDALMK